MNRRGWPYRPSREPKRDGDRIIFPYRIWSPYQTLFFFDGINRRIGWSVMHAGESVGGGQGKSLARAERLANRLIAKHKRRVAHTKQKQQQQ